MWLKNISTRYNISNFRSRKMMLSLVPISIKIVFKSTWNKNYFGVSQREETYVARASEKLNYFFDLTNLMFLTINKYIKCK